MLLGGFQPLTLLDYPGHTACMVFTAGCNMRCGYCHNPELVIPQVIRTRAPESFMAEEDFFAFLAKRKGLLDGVVITGGEPTVQADLLDFMRRVKAQDFLVKLDSNGANPGVLQQAIDEKIVDFIAMDIKAPPSRYNDLMDGQATVDTAKITQSKNIILGSGLPHEFRTTVLQGFHSENDVREIAQFCAGAQTLALQNFRPGAGMLYPRFAQYRPFSAQQMQTMSDSAKPYAAQVLVRG